MIEIMYAWFRMRWANIGAYLLSHQGEHELADLAEDAEKRWAGELETLIINRRYEV